MAVNFDTQGKNVDVVVTIAASNTTDGMFKATKHAAAYAIVPCDMDIDKVRLSFALSANANAAGSGNFGIGIYANNVSLTSAQIAVAYDTTTPYTTVDRANLAVKSLTEGQLLRIDILEVPAGAATSYPMNAIVRIQGASKG